MKELEKNILMNELFDIYGELLSSSQKKMIHLYYRYDLSLQEIASQENVSRNAVYDALKKGFDALLHYEEILCFRKKRIEFNDKLNSLKDSLNEETFNIVYNKLKEG